MANKPIKVAKTITPEQLREQQKQQALQQLAQRRESFAINILCNAVRGEAFLDAKEGVKIVDTAVAMADHLMEKLYTVKKDTDNENIG